jgi:hypothetical protein
LGLPSGLSKYYLLYQIGGVFGELCSFIESWMQVGRSKGGGLVCFHVCSRVRTDPFSMAVKSRITACSTSPNLSEDAAIEIPLLSG